MSMSKEESDFLNSEISFLNSVIASLNAISIHQTDRAMMTKLDDGGSLKTKLHPLTCENDSTHTPLYPYWDGQQIQLICRDCDYTQDNGAMFSQQRKKKDG